ncbi:hypothetical protein TRFO_42374 [Tritrichomonas foetus]|uniref:Protein kinase domain-containing protein n=1 Tax=Tritrichomonas foetus TaxID=1144522 RepID=A0A1J4KWP0_9EUKA|nr:hypothetical protein TRFO_42374 [Tritrichomonas foetus]|eukprot:OHT15667.1 hypothetical protein TRFO_42374 [Tritrichomonas foetus]
MYRIGADEFSKEFSVIKEVSHAESSITFLYRHNKSERLLICKSFDARYIEDRTAFIKKFDDIYESNLTPSIVKFVLLVGNENEAKGMKELHKNKSENKKEKEINNNGQNKISIHGENSVDESSNLKKSEMSGSNEYKGSTNYTSSECKVNTSKTDVSDTSKFVTVLRPFVTGLSLGETLNNNSSYNYYKIWKKIVEIYESLHRFNISPNTIKLSNIFVESEDVIRLVGVHPKPSNNFSAMYTPSAKDFVFYAPEFFTHEYDFNEKSDMWSLGALLLYMFTRQLPWSTVNVCAMIRQITESPQVKIPDDLPTHVKKVVSRLLVVDPRLRLTASQILAQVVPNLIIPQWEKTKTHPKRNSLGNAHLSPSALSIINQNMEIYGRPLNMRSTKVLPPLNVLMKVNQRGASLTSRSDD